MIDALCELLVNKEVIGSVLGGLIGACISFTVATQVAESERRRDYYVHVDARYEQLLRLYMGNPDFGDLNSTAKYEEAFSGKMSTEYHFFAWTVNDFCESIWDTFYDSRSQKFHHHWKHIFEHHTKLHENWLRNNQALFEADYVKFVLANSSQN